MLAVSTDYRLTLSAAYGPAVRALYEIGCNIDPKENGPKQNYRGWPPEYFEAVGWAPTWGLLGRPTIWLKKPSAENGYRVVAELTWSHDSIRRGQSRLCIMQSETQWFVETQLYQVWWKEYPAAGAALQKLVGPIPKEV